MHSEPRGRVIDPFLVNYTAKDLRIASEFLSNWIPFLSRGLCSTCTESLANRVQFLDSEVDGDLASPLNHKSNLAVSTPDNVESNEFKESLENCDLNSLGSWKEAADINEADTNSLGSWKDGANDWLEPIAKALLRDTAKPTLAPVRKMWADMVQEDEFEGDEESEVCGNSVDGHAQSGEDSVVVSIRQKLKLSRDQREFIRFSNVKRKKDFICLERYKGEIVNILEGLELHTGIFSSVEQKRIVDFVYKLQEVGKKGELKNRILTAPRKWMRGKGRVPIQFGCYNYVTDKNGNPPGILQNEIVDPIPPL